MRKIINYLFLKTKLEKIITNPKGKNVLIIDRQRIFSVLKNYLTIKILQKKNLINLHVLTDLEPGNQILKFYNFLGIESSTKTFRASYLFLSPFITFKTLSHLIFFFFFFLKNDFNNFICKYSVSNIKVGDIIYDRYIRNDFSFLKPSIYNLKFIRIFLFTVFKTYWIEKYIKKNKVKLILINTHIYANNYSIAYKLAKKNKINLLYLKDFQITYFKKGSISKDTDPRAITKNKLKNIILTKEKIKNLKIYMKRRTSGKLAHFDVKNAFGSRKNQMKKFLAKKKIKLSDYKKIILLASHSLSDANHFHFDLGSSSPFKDYYSQIVETLNFALKNKNILFFIRPHPSSDFWNEEGLIKNILKKYKSKNIVLLDKNINTDDAIKHSDTVITVYGTIGLETASFYKKKPILAGNSIYSNLGFTLDSSTKQDYFDHILSNKKKYSLNRREQLQADKALYYYFLKFNLDYRSVISNQNRNLTDKIYFTNLEKFLKKKTINQDMYFKKLNKVVKNIKI